MDNKKSNKNLLEIVTKILETVDVSSSNSFETIDKEKMIGTSWISLSSSKPAPRYEDLVGYSYVRISAFFNIEGDLNSPKGYLLTPLSEGFTFWGYLKEDFSDYIPEDFTHFAPGLNNGKGWDNFFRDHLELSEAKESIVRLKELVDSL